MTMTMTMAAAIIGIMVGAGLLSAAIGGAYVRVARRRFLDSPNARSSHRVPTPTSGGVAFLAVLVPAWWPALYAAGLGALPATVSLAALVGLAILSWFDDRRNLPISLRFGGHVAAVAAVLAVLPAEARLAEFLPLWLERLVLGLAWLWFVNLFNFMDGIDGLAASEALAVAGGVLLIGVIGAPLAQVHWPAALMVGAVAGYLFHNWPPARLFMGDVGSVPLGFLLGLLLIVLALEGNWLPALLLPACFWADATVTLLHRAVAGLPFWRAHKDHFYQRAVQAGASHRAVTLRVCLVNGGLIAIVAGAALAGDTGAARAAALGAGTVLIALLLTTWRCVPVSWRRPAPGNAP